LSSRSRRLRRRSTYRANDNFRTLTHVLKHGRNEVDDTANSLDRKSHLLIVSNACATDGIQSAKVTTLEREESRTELSQLASSTVGFFNSAARVANGRNNPVKESTVKNRTLTVENYRTVVS